MLVWPNLSRARTVSIRLLLLWDEVQSLTSFLISLSFLPSRAKEFHFRCHPLVMASLSGLLISVWGIALWGAVRALDVASFAAASGFSFPRTLTCPGTQHRSMIILSSLALRISSLILTKIGEKEESDLSAKRALLESEKIVNRLPSMVPFKISCMAALKCHFGAHTESQESSWLPGSWALSSLPLCVSPKHGKWHFGAKKVLGYLQKCLAKIRCIWAFWG